MLRGHRALRRWSSSTSSTLTPAVIDSKYPLLSIPKADVFRFGEAPPSPALFTALDWTVHDGEAWAVVGHGSVRKTQLLETLRGNHRIHPTPPPPYGLWPALSASGLDPYNAVTLVSFAHRSQSSGSGFVDYSARYGALRDEDRTTLRTLLGLDAKSASTSTIEAAEELVTKLGLRELLDLPAIALSNGQTRRARIIRALLARPHVLLLDEPLTGLDIHTRSTVSAVLQSLHDARAPRVLLGLRAQDPVPEWITHVLDVDVPHTASSVNGGGVWIGSRSTWEGHRESPGGRPAGSTGSATPQKTNAVATPSSASTPASSVPTSKSSTPKSPTSKPDAPEAPILAALHNIHIAYGSNSNSGSSSNTTTTRPVLSGLNWTIRAGERWHLQGANGSGKTTLLALLTGAHPLSYAQRPSAANGFKTQLVLFGRPRHMIPTAELARMVGLVSPELADSIPRAEGRTVWDVVGTGFEGTHVPRGNARVGDVAGDRAEEDRRVNRMWEVLKALGPVAWAPSTSTSSSVGNTNINTNINTNMNVSAVENGSTQVQTQKPIVAYPAATNVDSAPDAQTTVFARKPFARLSPGERSLVLLARALVGRPPLLILDEAWAGMDASMVSAARAYLRSEGGVAKGVLGQAVVVVSHWAGEVPWEGEEVRKIRLEEGMAIVDE